MKKVIFGAFGLLALLSTTPLLMGAAGGVNATAAADGGTQTTLTGTSAVVLKARDGRAYGQIISLAANTTNVSCALQTVRGTNPTATATQIVLVPGGVLNVCTGTNCFGGSVSCVAVSGSPIVTSVDF